MRRIVLKVALLVGICANSPVLADDRCFTESQINQIVKTNGLFKKGVLEVDAKTSDIAFINRKPGRFLSVKKTGKCYFDPTFLTEAQYEERYQFEGEGGEE